MLRRLSSSLTSIKIGLILIAIAFVALFFLQSQVALHLNLLIFSLVNQRGQVITDSPEIIDFRRIIAGGYLLQNVYIFLTGLVFLIAGLFKQTNR
ncbi:hypothetical protein H6G20_05815 [Desertifilum sp. FACHB-1129]|uniref:hypothetical protein n=1 Tax=unclassified Desertifilum TaxID=2621682 RepID=UPI0013CC0C12|nr:MULTISPECIES: hypothetical protein [unclassified Desertifilum]MDA0213720.1 hypothetical protein [Cyanobacteria bacterium FC1]MDI9636281.1 hypothetical protein [Geitlerinema splendidum]NES95994.1 hypothetical protein [Desertifilum sp. SIO1I2]MBD2311174.1 hypothetical protein [Desertifilum sp. FACHB-1129]MBD2324381.1 hypothetical protein [Desertifilum sp. FACHB-866]